MSRYSEEYKRKLVTADEAVKCVEPGMRVDYGFMTSKPVVCDQALAKRADELSGVEVSCAITLPPVPEVVKRPDVFAYHDLHFSKIARILQRDYNICYYTPIMYHMAGEWFRKNIADKQHVYIAQVCPMDEHGYFNFSLTNSVSMANIEHVDTVILEVNKNLPVALGGQEEAIHISQVDFIVEAPDDQEVFVPPAVEPTETDREIAKNIMKYLYDGCCIQLGIGGMPNAVGTMIADSDLKNLGGHTEMLSDAYVAMIESGRMNGSKKSIDKYRVPYTFSMGSQKLYDFVHNNPALASCSAAYTNDPRVIQQLDDFVSINNAVQVDLYSQVNGESSGMHQISGNGGMWDFVLGAQWSKNGKSFICLSSTVKDKDGNLQSRIVPSFDPCTIVTIPRQQVDYIVTEYGAAQVRAKSTWRRAEMLIDIAHPDFREELIKKAQEQKIWRPSNKKDA
jgi:acyl-CoA hydrolase